ncbi:MAG: pirin family protein, partial [Gammaproteobacteria bacterium]
SNNRSATKVVDGMPTSDGAGVNLTRLIGMPGLDMLDPFLLLDSIRSDDPNDYIAGFPPHPHRGFETVTYILAGKMRHKDSTGREGVIEAGGVQWMTAGSGIIHSEMPEQEEGLLYGFQLWVNLPATLKMTAPEYREYPAEDIATETRDAGVTVRVITGTTSQGTQGPVRNVVTEPLFIDVDLPAGARFTEDLPESHGAFIHLVKGQVSVEGPAGGAEVTAGALAVLEDGQQVSLVAGEEGARLLLVAGRRLDEPVARYGPFVMNTQAELMQAAADYQSGRFVSQ